MTQPPATPATELDRAHAAMVAMPDDDAARLQFYDRLAGSELVLMLENEPDGDAIQPELFDVGDARFVLVFDTEFRLAEFADRSVPYAALSGRALVQMLAGQGIGLGVNLEVAPSSILIPSEAVDWLAETVAHRPKETEARITELRAPGVLPDRLLSALDARLAATAGLARKAYLAEADYDTGTRTHVIGLTGVAPGAEPALAQAINEALVFSGVEAGTLDVLFLSDTDPTAGQLARVALRFDLPEPPKAQTADRPAPGSNPDKPPILR